MNAEELKDRCKEQIEQYEGDLIGPQMAAPPDIVNWQLSPHRTQLENAGETTEGIADLLRVNPKTITRYQEKGMPAFWKENQERDGREQWFFCPQGVLFWCIRAHASGEIELPPGIAHVMQHWPAFVATMKELGANIATDGTLAGYEGSGLHWSYMDAIGERAWLMDPDMPTKAERTHRRKMLERMEAVFAGHSQL
jgi:hypothetical protein